MTSRPHSLIVLLGVWLLAGPCDPEEEPVDGGRDAGTDASVCTRSGDVAELQLCESLGQPEGCVFCPACEAGGPPYIVVPPGCACAPPERCAPPRLSISPALQDFGDVCRDRSSHPATFTVMAVGGRRPSDPLSTTIGGGDATNFNLGADTCAGARLWGGETCTIAVTFEPGFDIGRSSATLDVSPGLAVPATLEGNGQYCLYISITPTPRDFGSTTAGTPTSPTRFTVTNGDDTPLGTLTIIVGGPDPSQFTLGADNCTGMVLEGRTSCTVEGIYSPTAVGAHSAALEATASPGGTVSAAVTGNAIPPAALLLLPGVQDFGSVVASSCTSGSSASVDFTLTNTGGARTGTLAHSFGGPDASEFMVTSSFCVGASLAPMESCLVSLRFNAGAPGAKTATLDMTDGTLMASAMLSATSASPGLNSIRPSLHDFGTSPVGVATAGFTFIVTNNSACVTGPLSVALAGADAADFTIPSGGDGCSGARLVPSGSCTVATHFEPTATGARTAVLRVGATPGGVTSASLSGSGG